MSQKKAIHFGGGNIGRGFVAEFLHKSGYEVVFVDVVDALIEKLKSTKSYLVKEVGSETTEEFKITNYRAISSKNEESKVVDEIATADIVTCAVGPNILKFIAPVIAKGIDKRHKQGSPLAVIACENAIGATDTLKGFIVEKLEETSEGLLSEKARFANSAVDRIVPVQENPDSLDVVIEKFYEWCVDKSPFKDIGHPQIEGVHFVDDLIPYIERKLFTVNTGHACSAYHGHRNGKKYIHEVLADEKLKAIVQETLAETSKLIVNKHGITESDQKAYVDSIIVRISNPLLKDGVDRVGRAPLRKLSRKERFIAPAAELAERGEKIDGLLGCIEHALYFQNVQGDDESVELAKILKELSAADATEKLTGLHKDHPLYAQVEKIIAKVQKGN